MLEWMRDRYRKATTKPCDSCGEPVAVSAYRKTGRSERREGLLAGVAVELECPNCGDTFWVRR
jgi:predicted RNA-binding Zn-ribbon protein involved in translation (DUF1610 family)